MKPSRLYTELKKAEDKAFDKLSAMTHRVMAAKAKLDDLGRKRQKLRLQLQELTRQVRQYESDQNHD